MSKKTAKGQIDIPALVFFTRTMTKKIRLTKLKIGDMTAAGIRSFLVLFHRRANSSEKSFAIKKARPKATALSVARMGPAKIQTE